MTKILVTGLAALDLIFRLDHLPKLGEKYLANEGFLSGGGNAGNAAVATARLGGQVSIFAAVGRDDVGALILKGFQHEGIDTRLVIQLEDHQSSFSSIVIPYISNPTIWLSFDILTFPLCMFPRLISS